MIQPNSSKKNDSEAKQANSTVDKSKCYLVKGTKPLQKYRFYLDIKNHAVTNKLEQKIKELGGVVEFFLIREVTHVISDRQECMGLNTTISPQTPAGTSVESIYPNESPKPESVNSRAGQTRLKTRADAMLEKVRSQSGSAVRDPLKNAKLWDIPIWTVNKILSWLEKVSANITISSVSSKSKGGKQSVKQISIKAPFIKFEPVTRDARPVYKTLDYWPLLDFDAAPGKPAFCMKTRERSVELESLEANDSGRMTRKGRPRLSVRGSIKDTEEKPPTEKHIGGYCEICHTEYLELSEHLRSDAHQQFMRNDANFLTLDSLIGASANVEAFLRLNGGSPMKDGLRRSLRNGRSPNGKINGVDEYCRPLTRNKMYNTRYSSNHSALSPTGSDGGHRLRSRGQLWLPSNLLGTTAEDEACPNKPKESARQERKNSRLNDDEIKHNKEVEKEAKHNKESDKEAKHNKESDKEAKHNKDSDKESRHNKESDKEAKHSKESEKESKSHKNSDKDGKSSKDNDKDGKHRDHHEDKKHPEHGKGKRTCIKNKRISADERLVVDNKTYYKVEVMTTKLRSSGLGNREHELTKRTQTPIPEEDLEDEPSLVVKFKKVRRSELSVLNDEAENFMFPRKEDSSFGDLDTDDGPNTTCSTNKNDSVDIPSSEIDIIKTPAKLFKTEPSEDSVEDYLDSIALKHRFKCESDIVNKRKSKKIESETLDETSKSVIKNCTKRDNFVRRSTRKGENPLVLDETLDDTAQDGSVMVEISTKKKKKSEMVESTEDHDFSKDGTSRDSASGSVCDSEGKRKKRRTQAEVFIEDNQKYFKFETPGSRLRYQGMFFNTMKSPARSNGEQEEEKPKVEEKRPEFSLKDIKFSFEIEPKSEPWYQTFTRQDRGEERYSSLSEPGYQARLILPYQLPANLAPLDPKICIAHYERIKNYLINPEAEEQQPSTSTAENSVSEPSTSASSAPKPEIHYRRRKRKTRFMMKSNHPRKSPRQHASTLAILSSLIHQRKKREKKQEKERELDLSRSSLTAIPEEDTSIVETPQPVEKVEVKEVEIINPETIAQNLAASQLISEILSAPMDDIDIGEEIDGIFLKDKPDAIELIQNYDNVISNRNPNQTPGLSETVRTIRRKRKKNRTGWPKKKRLFPRKPGMKSDESVALPETEDSRLTDGSLEDMNVTDNLKESDTEEVINDCANDDGSDVENRTISELEALNTDSVDSNCNLNESERKCEIKTEPTEETCEVKKTKSEIVEMLNDSSEDILVVYDNLKQGVPQCVIKNDAHIINRISDKINCVVKSDTDNITKEIVRNIQTDSAESQKNDNVGVKQNCPNKKEQRNSSSDSPAEEVLPSSEDKEEDCVNVDLNTWENAEKVLHAKMADNEQVKTSKMLQYQPFVRVQKIDNKIHANRRLRSSSSPDRKPKAKRPRLSQPISPRSPRKLRAPRGKWYRER